MRDVEMIDPKLTRLLLEAHAVEQEMMSTLISHVAVTPAGQYRTSLEAHLRVTRTHAQRIEKLLRRRDSGRSLVQLGFGVAQSVVGQVAAAGKVPMVVVRGTSGEEKLLRNAQDEYAAEAREVAMYLALEQLATSLGDSDVAQLARSIRRDEEQMVEQLRDRIDELARDVASRELGGRSRFAVTRMGAVDAARTVVGAAAHVVVRSARRTERIVTPPRTAPHKPARTSTDKPASRRASASSRSRSTTARSTAAKKRSKTARTTTAK